MNTPEPAIDRRQRPNRLAQIEGFATLTIGLVLFAVFVAGLRAVATRSEPWSSLMFGTGLATVLCLVSPTRSGRPQLSQR
jgi:hypothetical protein